MEFFPAAPSLRRAIQEHREATFALEPHRSACLRSLKRRCGTPRVRSVCCDIVFAVPKPLPRAKMAVLSDEYHIDLEESVICLPTMLSTKVVQDEPLCVHELDDVGKQGSILVIFD